MLNIKIVQPKKVYKFPQDHLLIRHIVIVLIVKILIRNYKFRFPVELRKIRKKINKKKNGSPKKDLQGCYLSFFDK